MIFEISTAIGCPVLCSWCPQQRIDAAYTGPRLMSMETLVRCLEKVPRDAVVSFAGYAEPFLNPRCAEMILYAHNRGHQVMLYATCVGMDMKDWDRIREIPFKILCLHLADTERNAKIDVTVEYICLVEAIISDKQHETCLQLMAMGTPDPRIEQHVSVCAEKWAFRKFYRDPYLHTRAGNVENKLVPMRKRGAIRCTQNAEQKDNVLLPNGDLALCCADYGLQHVIGNLLEQGYDEIFEGEKYKKIRAGMLDGSDLLCRTCEFSAACA